MSNYAKLLALLVLIAASWGGSWKAYKSGEENGKASVQALWDADKAAQTTAALEAEKKARARERDLVKAKQKAEEQHAEFKRRAQISIDGAQSELDRLRSALANRQTDNTAASNPATSPRIDAAAPIERQLLGQCATTLTGLAQQADQLAAQLTGLQGYVTAACKTQ